MGGRESSSAIARCFIAPRPTPFADFDDYWRPFLGGQGPAPTYAMGLDESARARLRERLRVRLPIRPDGSLALVARAWAVRATVAR